MVTAAGSDGAHGSNGADAAAGTAVEVIGVSVHELCRAGEDDLEVRPLATRPLSVRALDVESLEVHPVEVHELPAALRLVGSAEPARSPSAVPGEQGGVTRTSAVRLVPTSGTCDGPAAALAPAAASEDVARAAGGDAVPEARSLLEAPSRRPGRRRRGPVAPWLRRRFWVVLLVVLAGVAGGVGVTRGRRGSYSAKVLLEVRPGDTPASPGGAQEASALAVTYAALVPNDTAVLDALAGRLQLPTKKVASALSATAESGTGLFVVSFSATTPARAIAGANEAGTILASAAPPGLAIVARSVAVVKRAAAATHSKDTRRYGLVGGALGGLLLGAVLVFALERADARVDDPEDATEVCGCPATRWPGGMSARELAAALEHAADDGRFALVPTSTRARASAERLSALLAGAAAGGQAVTHVVPFDESPASLSEAKGSAVLVVRPGDTARAVADVCARLRLLGRSPVFVVLGGGR